MDNNIYRYALQLKCRVNDKHVKLDICLIIQFCKFQEMTPLVGFSKRNL